MHLSTRPSSYLVFAGIFFSLILDPVIADDLENPKVMKVLDRLASEGRRRPLPVSRLYKTDAKNRIVELKLREAKVKKGDLETLSKLEKLETLDLSRSTLTDKQMQGLSSFSSLKSLNLHSTKITGSGLAHLRMKVLLESLDLGSTRIDDSSLRVCKTLNNLRQLKLRGCKITDKGLVELQELKKLTLLDLGDTDMTDDSVRMLTEISSLRSLILDDTKVSFKGIEKLAKSENLSWIATPESTAKEWVRRVQQKELGAAFEMNPVGLSLPGTGTYSKASITPKKRQLKDMINHLHRFRIRFLWEVDGRKTTMLFAELGVNRGAVKILEMGIEK